MARAETRDGRLLVFEADTAAIIHLMDPPDLFPYKPPQMRKVFAAFEAMLRQHAGLPVAHAPVGPDPVARDPVGHDPVGHGRKDAVMPPAPAPLRTTQADRREPSAGRGHGQSRP